MKRKIHSKFNSLSKHVRITTAILFILFFVYTIFIFVKDGWQGIFNNLPPKIVTGSISLLGIYEVKVLFFSRNFNDIKPSSTPTIVFVDRSSELKKLINLILEKQNINIIGQSGIGKTYLAKQLTAILNLENTLEDKYKKMTPTTDVLAFYIHNENNLSLEEFVIREVNNSTNKEILTINNVLKLFDEIGTKHIILTFDGIKKDAEQRAEIELLLKKLQMDKVQFIIISEEALNAPQVIATSFDIGKNRFTTVEIGEMVGKIYVDKIDMDIEAIFHNSSGLPVLIDLFVRNSHPEGNYHFSSILESLWKSESQYNLFREIIVRCIYDNSAEIEDISFAKIDIDALNDKYFISYKFEKNQVNIHKLVEQGFHYVFDKRDKEIYQSLHAKAFMKYRNADAKRALTHLLCANAATINKESEFIIATYEALFVSDSYDILLNCFQSFNNRYNKSGIDKKITTYIIYGNLYSLMGVGSYKDADNFFGKLTVDYAPLQVNQAANEMDYRFLFKKADLSHLVNHFEIALEDLELLIISLKSSDLPQKIKEMYDFEYQLLRAHIYGHMGENLYNVVKVYSNLLAQVNKFYKQEPFDYATIYIKSLYGLICSHMALHSDTNEFSYEAHFEMIKEAISEAPSELEHLHYRVNRHYSMFLRQKKDFIKSEKVLKDSVYYFEQHNHRIIYDFYFSLADLYREQEKFDDAIENYKMAEQYAKNISDTNLYIYCRLGTILAMVQNQKNKEQYIVELINLLREAKEAKMYIHVLHIQLILYALTNQQETNGLLVNELSSRGLNFEKYLIEKDWSIRNLNNLHLIVR
ncbi:hypothetical protein [Listeria seeligeri]|uniref:hypothetical protein n=1 Tax=Listeria seeligeri TaxID=1640 RepID=UPI0022EBC41B|nr:hypothetical protein [Listeria seeligeri]